MQTEELKNVEIDKIIDFVNQQGTLVQEDFFEQTPVHHLTDDKFCIGDNVIRYIGKNAAFTQEGVKYLYSDLSIKEIMDITKLLSI
jgi:hypothetical protein